MRARVETWGAWVRLEEPAALVALDREGARAMGLDVDAFADDPGPLEAHVAVTSQCGVGCEGCYLDARPDGAHVPRQELEQTLDDLAARGVFTVAFGGGEPILRDDLGELAKSARARGLLPVVTTSGIYGQITKLNEKSVQVQIADKVRIEVARAAIGGYQGQEPVVAPDNGNA